MKEKTCCFTGHRELPADRYSAIALKTETVIEELIQKGYRYFGAGGALGFDTLAAQAILRLQKRYPEICLILVLPCPEQSAGWSSENKRIYEEIKAAAHKVVYTSESYTKGCMHKRNRHLADNSSICIAYLTKEKGGTFYTVNYARKKGILVINVADLL